MRGGQDVRDNVGLVVVNGGMLFEDMSKTILCSTLIARSSSPSVTGSTSGKGKSAGLTQKSKCFYYL